MFPIYTDIGPRGLGMSYQDFSGNFEKICSEHITRHRALGFAFIFYREHSLTSEIINSKDGYNHLNRISGEDLTVFSLTNPDYCSKEFEEFNKRFLATLNINHYIEPPCMAFFRVSDGEISDIDLESIDEGVPFHIALDQIERKFNNTIQEWKKQGNFSALKIDLLSFIANLRGAAGF